MKESCHKGLSGSELDAFAEGAGLKPRYTGFFSVDDDEMFRAQIDEELERRRPSTVARRGARYVTSDGDTWSVHSSLTHEEHHTALFVMKFNADGSEVVEKSCMGGTYNETEAFVKVARDVLRQWDASDDVAVNPVYCHTVTHE
jgi:hypothetical protein